MKNKLDEELRLMKPNLRFKVGDLVCLKSDTKKNTPMNIVAYLDSNDLDDYICVWLNSQKVQERQMYPDSVLEKFEIESK
ncbi:MAG: hypothetical protein N4A71_02425 [Carboxylicivirga sp.]|jgi:uncharacterized protein YodC (DUF2158 family)|nr:hypothetical protein [Carboxylicivirga sp.]